MKSVTTMLVNPVDLVISRTDNMLVNSLLSILVGASHSVSDPRLAALSLNASGASSVHRWKQHIDTYVSPLCGISVLCARFDILRSASTMAAAVASYHDRLNEQNYDAAVEDFRRDLSLSPRRDADQFNTAATEPTKDIDEEIKITKKRKPVAKLDAERYAQRYVMPSPG